MVAVTYLRLYIQYTTSALLFHLTDGLEAGSIKVAWKLGVLDEGLILDQILEGLDCNVEVLFSMYFAGSRGSGSVYCKMGYTATKVGIVCVHTRNTKAKFIREFNKETLKERAFTDTGRTREDKWA